MQTIYIDADYKCHTANAEGRRAVKTDEFCGKCTEYIDGYRFVPAGEIWVRADGTAFSGEMIAPWKPWEELDAAQREFERQQLADYEQALSDIEAALGVSG